MICSGLISLLAATAVLGESQHGHPHSRGWIPDFKNLVSFGDSYTDESRLGYFFSSGGSPPPPGTLLPPSNNTAGGGITWARYVALSSGAMLYNYAVSGAVCSNDIIYRYLAGIKQAFPDVVYEVNAFVADINFVNATTNTNTLYTNRKADNTVYSMWIGTNDLGVGAFLTDSSLSGTTIPDYVDCIFNRFDTLYKNGARYFVLMNTAPLELSPLYGLPAAGGQTASHYWSDKPSNITEVSYKMKEYTRLVNDVYKYQTPFELLVAKRYPGASIAVFDTHSLMSEIYYSPTAYLAAPANVTGQYYLCDVATGQQCTSQTSVGADHFFWYDELHPSQQVDKAIASEFLNVVKGTSKYATYW